MAKQMLIVIQSNTLEPIVYSNKIDVDIKTEVRAAFNQLAIPYKEEAIELVSKTIPSCSFWIDNNRYCFTLINID